MAVLNALKPGLDEKIYERALVIELTKRGHAVEQQKRFQVRYLGSEVGELIPDLVVDRTVIVDTKVCSDFNDVHLAQMIGYLSISELQIALLMSFKHANLMWKRVVRERAG